MSNFFEIIEEVKKFDYDELKELNFITNKYLSDLDKDRILKSHNESMKEFEEGKLTFSSNFSELKKMLD